MLTLSRKVGEHILLRLPDGTRIRIYLTQLLGRRARISTDAPKAVRITRGELDEEHEENSMKIIKDTSHRWMIEGTGISCAQQLALVAMLELGLDVHSAGRACEMRDRVAAVLEPHLTAMLDAAPGAERFDNARSLSD